MTSLLRLLSVFQPSTGSEGRLSTKHPQSPSNLWQWCCSITFTSLLWVVHSQKTRASWSIWKKSAVGNPSALNLLSSSMAGSNKLTEMGVLPSASGLSAVITVPTDYCCTLVCSHCSSRWLQACECACGGSNATVTCTILGCGEGCSGESSLMWADSMPPFCPLLFKRLNSTQTSRSNCGHDCTPPYLLCRTKREDRAKA